MGDVERSIKGDRPAPRGNDRGYPTGGADRGRASPQNVTRIYVGNLPSTVQKNDLEDLFDKYGRIVDVSIKRTVSGAPFAFIEFEDGRDAEDAIRVETVTTCLAADYAWKYHLLLEVAVGQTEPDVVASASTVNFVCW